MDALSADDLENERWMNEYLRISPELSPGEAARFEAMLKEARAVVDAKLRMPRRKKEDATAGPSEKISIRIPRPLLSLIREQAALAGMPYQTLIKSMLHDFAMK